MTMAAALRRSTAAVATVLMLALPAGAQEIAESHLKAARAAISALGTTAEFDNILPQAAQALKNELINKNPDMVQLISQTVDQKALDLASRRGDLEREAATIYAKVFSEQELNEIATFYNGAAGKKLLQDGNIAFRELTQAAGIWQRGLARDLAQQVGEELNLKAQPQTGSSGQQPAPAAQPNANQ